MVLIYHKLIDSKICCMPYSFICNPNQWMMICGNMSLQYVIRPMYTSKSNELLIDSATVEKQLPTDLRSG